MATHPSVSGPIGPARRSRDARQALTPPHDSLWFPHYLQTLLPLSQVTRIRLHGSWLEVAKGSYVIREVERRVWCFWEEPFAHAGRRRSGPSSCPCSAIQAIEWGAN